MVNPRALAKDDLRAPRPIRSTRSLRSVERACGHALARWHRRSADCPMMSESPVIDGNPTASAQATNPHQCWKLGSTNCLPCRRSWVRVRFNLSQTGIAAAMHTSAHDDDVLLSKSRRRRTRQSPTRRRHSSLPCRRRTSTDGSRARSRSRAAITRCPTCSSRRWRSFSVRRSKLIAHGAPGLTRRRTCALPRRTESGARLRRARRRPRRWRTPPRR